MFEHLPDAALLLDAEKRVLAANRALLLALGPMQPVRPGMAPERLFAAASRPALAAWLQGGAAPAELRLVAPEGRAGHPVAPKGIAMPDRGMVLLLHDVTQRHAMAAEMAESDRLQALGRLAGGIAHDFNNLLAVVLGAADHATSSLGPSPDPAVAGELEQIRQAAQRGAALVRQLLAYARQQVLAPKLVSLNGAVEGMARLLRPLLGRQISLEVTLDEPGRMVRIDPSQLDRVLMNLAMNARQAMPEGGRLTLSTGRALLLEPLAGGPEEVPPGRWTVLEVADTGTGIPPELLSRIFEPFFTSRAQQGGTGLGLATVHGIVRQSGGHLLVDSAPGRGTRIRILLPRVEETEPVAVKAAAAAPAPPPPRQGTGPLLLVEDEAPLRSLAERALRRAGWEVVVAEDGEAALALVEETALAPVAVVSDVMMPGMGGVALASELRQRFPGLPVLLVSGYAASVVQNGLDESGMKYLAKPYRPAELVEAVKALVEA
ncbi:response regulator [Roseomonas sp. E05]|uniref:ATP-binding protein n=1 Tax=Roseomonas sp. E05 TaxID=3046310 RepID=UPI0024BAA2E9|nr:ATP-binding protein [Roseomonas sp. E05]MDJ0389618.1 response regulator [Roseomonas sp. E05]